MEYSDFVTYASCVPDTKIIPKDAQKFMACVPWDAKIDDVFVEYPVRVICVAVLVAVV